MTPKAPKSRAALRFLRFKVQHDCPLAKFSREFPDVVVSVWSSHTVSVLQVTCSNEVWEQIETRASATLRVQMSMSSRDGGIIVIKDNVDPKGSISRTLEAHSCLWLQPMTLRGGWEEYGAIAYGQGDEPEANAVESLRQQGVLRVIERHVIDSEELLESLFLPMRSVLTAATAKQADALVAACHGGYYAAPRRITTAKLAASLGLGRTSYEERLRGGENNILRVLGPFLEQHRVREGNP